MTYLNDDGWLCSTSLNVKINFKTPWHISRFKSFSNRWRWDYLTSKSTIYTSHHKIHATFSWSVASDAFRMWKSVLFSVHGFLFAPLSMNGQNVKTENQLRANKSGDIAFCTDHFGKLHSIFAYATKFIPNWHWQNKSSFPWFCILNKHSLALFNCWCCVQ